MASVSAAKKQKEEEETKKEGGENLEEKVIKINFLETVMSRKFNFFLPFSSSSLVSLLLQAPPPERPRFSADMYNSYLRMFYCVFLSSFAAISFEQSQG